MTEDKQLTDPQQEVLDRLPEDLETLAEQLSLSVEAVHSRISRARGAGVEIHYNPDTEKYYPPQSSDIPEEEARNEYPVSRSDLVDDLRGTGLTYSDFADEYDVGKNTASTIIDRLQRDGFPVDYKVTDQYGTRLWYIDEDRDQVYSVDSGEGVYRFALISDTHLGSSVEHLRELHRFYDRVQQQGIEHVYHAGDITDGWEVHKGHINVVKGEAAGWNRLLDYTVRNYPERDGVDTFFIEGNHDRKYHRRNGLHLGELIGRRRRDLHYCGDSQATFVLDEDADIDLELIHPSGGKPYTQGYRAQTLYRERPPADRPTISGIGHLHGKMYAAAEDVEAFYTGCWKGLTTYGKRKGHDSEIGGWIIEIEIEDGELRRVSPDWIGYESQGEANVYDAEGITEMTNRRPESDT